MDRPGDSECKSLCETEARGGEVSGGCVGWPRLQDRTRLGLRGRARGSERDGTTRVATDRTLEP